MIGMATPGPAESELLVVADAAAWREWLDVYEDAPDGVWLVLAKKGVTSPTSLSYAEALDEALCSGWIDGQRRTWNETTFIQRFTPRRARSLWSQRNVTYVARLSEQGRMRARGQAEIDRAKADGRWERAYAGPATAQVPEDLAAALDSSPELRSAFEALSSQDRFLVIHPLLTASTDATRAARLARSIEGLQRAADAG